MHTRVQLRLKISNISHVKNGYFCGFGAFRENSRTESNIDLLRISFGHVQLFLNFFKEEKQNYILALLVVTLCFDLCGILGELVALGNGIIRTNPFINKEKQTD